MKDVRLDAYGALVEVSAAEMLPPDHFPPNVRITSMDDTDFLPVLVSESAMNPVETSHNEIATKVEPSRSRLTGERKRLLVLGACAGAVTLAIATTIAHHPSSTPSAIANVATHSTAVPALKPKHIASIHPTQHDRAHRAPQKLALATVAHHPTATHTSAPVAPIKAKSILPPTVTHISAPAHPQAVHPLPPKIVELSLEAARVKPGEMAILHVRSIHARKIFITGSRISQWAFPIAWVPLHPVRTTTYQITALGAEGLKIQRSITVHVMPTPSPSVQVLPTPAITPSARGHHHHRR